MTPEQTNASDWLILAGDVHKALELAAADAMRYADGAPPWTAKDVAVRLLLRSRSNIEGIIALTRAGLVAEGRAIVRCLIENAFGAVMLLKNSKEYLVLLENDSERSQRNQYDFMLNVMHKKLIYPKQSQKIKDSIDKNSKPLIINQKNMAMNGSLKKLYLCYLWMSNDALHTTKRSLRRNYEIVEDKERIYKCSEATDAEHAYTLYWAIWAALAVGISITQLLVAKEVNAVFAHLSKTAKRMPKPTKI